MYYINLLFAIKEIINENELTTTDIAKAIALENDIDYSVNLRNRVLRQLKHLENANVVNRKTGLSKTKTRIYVWTKRQNERNAQP